MNKGLYIHIPFCNHICSYCDFARVIYNKQRVDDYLTVLADEIVSKDISSISTIYIGGGTPSSLSAVQLEQLLSMIKPYQSGVSEYTIEINPESLTYAKVELLARYGVNRVSIGLQVTQKHLLTLIERQHDFNQVVEAISLLNNVGITNISIDLMYGIMTQTIDDVKQSIMDIVKLPITHVSIYSLTIEPNSIMGHRGYREVDRDLDADMYELAVSELGKRGFERYEISNFAKEGYQSKHNLGYWHYDDFIGVGLNAAGKTGNIRYNNEAVLSKYLHNFGEVVINELTIEDMQFEYIMMNLRLSQGMSLLEYKRRFDYDFMNKYRDVIDDLSAKNLVEFNSEYIWATTQGLMLLHNVIERFMED